MQRGSLVGNVAPNDATPAINFPAISTFLGRETGEEGRVNLSGLEKVNCFFHPLIFHFTRVTKVKFIIKIDAHIFGKFELFQLFVNNNNNIKIIRNRFNL